MNAPVRRRPLVLRPRPRPEREPSDMHNELLARILGGLAELTYLSERDHELLHHFLFGRCPARTGARLGLRETTVHKHLHRIYARTGTQTRRELLELGLATAKRLEAAQARAARSNSRGLRRAA